MFSIGGSRSTAPILGPKVKDHLAPTRQLSSMPYNSNTLLYNATKQFPEFKYHQPHQAEATKVQHTKSSPSRQPHRKSPSKTKQKRRMMMEEIGGVQTDEIGLDASSCEVVQTLPMPETSSSRSYTTCPLKIKLTDLLTSSFGCSPSPRNSTSPKNTASPKSCSASPIEFWNFSWFATPATKTTTTCSFRKRLSSDCQSEDSFVIFANDGDELESDCFTEDEDSDEDDTQDEDESSGEMCHDMGHMNDLDDSEIIKKKVSFETREKLCTVHRMVTWPFAYRSARKGHWEELGRDRTRFSDRIHNIAPTIDKILSPAHRDTIYQQRFI